MCLVFCCKKKRNYKKYDPSKAQSQRDLEDLDGNNDKPNTPMLNDVDETGIRFHPKVIDENDNQSNNTESPAKKVNFKSI